MKLYFVYMAVGAADLPAAEADCRNLQAGSSELPEFHRHLPIAPRLRELAPRNASPYPAAPHPPDRALPIPQGWAKTGRSAVPAALLCRSGRLRDLRTNS